MRTAFSCGPSLFDNVTRDMDIYKQEIFGPVLSQVRTKSYEEALKLVIDNEYGNGTAIFTADGDTARDFASRVNASAWSASTSPFRCRCLTTALAAGRTSLKHLNPAGTKIRNRLVSRITLLCMQY